MKRTFSGWQRSGKGLAAAAAALSLGLVGASAQLAITEVMSEAAITFHGNTAPKGSDFFEVTNFGTNWVDLTGYTFTDWDGRSPDEGGACFWGVVLGPGESAIFFRLNLTTSVEQFQQWWGTCLTTDKIRGYSRPGFSPAGDGVRLYDAEQHPVAQVTFGEARVGVTFVYDPNCGNFGVYSVLGECGTGQAATTDDIGSPGTTCGPVPFRIEGQPTSQSNVCMGLDVSFCVRACGLPRPRYQWLFNGTPVPGANMACLTITNALASDEGEYRVAVTNGLETLLSEPAYLTVDTNPTSPLLLSRLIDVERFADETARFEAKVCAYPQPVFQWHSNGVPIVDATNSVLVLDNLSLETSGTVYCVGITNPLGSTNACARLLVAPSPQIEITEVMSAPSINPLCGPTANWWEATNKGTNAINLKGWRHLDLFSLEYAVVVTNDLILQPGESVVFVEVMTREMFIQWWGGPNLPPDLKVISYTGYGLRAWGEALYLWSPGAEEDLDARAGVSWASSTPFPVQPPTCPCDSSKHPMHGHSIFFDTNSPCKRDELCSQDGSNGAFQAAGCDDVGSPGWTAWTPPYWSSIHRAPSGLVLAWRAKPGSTNQVQYKHFLDDPVWTILADDVVAAGASRTVTDVSVGAQELRYYRIVSRDNGRTSELVFWPPPVVTPSSRVSCDPTLTLTWPTELSYHYLLQYRTAFPGGAWTALCTNLATGASMSVADPIQCGTKQRFYRVVCPEVSP